MSFSFFVINGKIPAVKLKAKLNAGLIPGSELIKRDDKRIIGIKYDKKGYWDGFIEKGNVVEFTEYAGGHGSDKAQDKLRERLEYLFRCEITMDEDEYAAWVKKSTGKALPKDPHADCDEVVYSKEFPKGKCIGNRSVSMDKLLGFKKQSPSPKKKLGVESVDLIKSVWG